MLTYIILGAVVVFFFVIIFTSYVKAPPNKAYIITFHILLSSSYMSYIKIHSTMAFLCFIDFN